MSLVEITQTTNHIENRNSLSKQVCCMSRSFDLPECGVGNARESREVPLRRT
jgi:hypothetical protein